MNHNNSASRRPGSSQGQVQHQQHQQQQHQYNPHHNSPASAGSAHSHSMIQNHQQSHPGHGMFPFRGVDETGKPYVQPTHGLGARAGKALSGGATYENLGGRMILRHEHSEHMKRLQTQRSVIDSHAPKSFVERKRQQKIYLSRFGMTPPPSTTQLLTEGNNNNAITSASPNRSTGGGSVGRLRSATTNNNNHHYSSSGSRAGSSSSKRGGSGGGGGGGNKLNNSATSAAAGGSSNLIHEKNVPSHDVFSSLTPDAQIVCKQTVEVLETLTTNDARTLLTQLLREAEEKRLLQAYSGVFPTMNQDSSGYDQQQQNQNQQQHHHHHHQQQQQQQQIAMQQQQQQQPTAHSGSLTRGSSLGSGSSVDDEL